MADKSITSSATDSTNQETRNTSNVLDTRSFQELNHSYDLPVDSAEHSRLDLQHELVRLMLGGKLYKQPELVQATLSAAENHKRQILDVGAGSGKWAIEIAETFPDAEILGIDLSLPSVLQDPSHPVPSNCAFKIADANCDMDKLDNIFDIVHQRCVESGINDSDLFFYDAARILRPNGLLLLVAVNPQLVDEKGRMLPIQRPGNEGYSHYQHMLGCMLEVHMKKGPFRLGHALWKSMLENNPNYTDVRVEEVLVPIGPWPVNMGETERRLAELMQEDILLVSPAFKAIFLRDGDLSEEFVGKLIDGVMKEIRELPPQVHGYVKWVFATAVRNEKPWTSRKEPWQEPPGFDVYDYVVRPLPKE
ncbi:hypothetical protein M407DRAFT_228858 [Tulasnella calospora MUT 4182]|uniref:Methyltransferase domain-containing protein n=1 Tax=Tulasnella calospora MUT 4182 TaxID=1051891 RepID=A0A0C3L6T6_9AGAM|nr:hypothetical protein M407DRAFT_228858 [Tulasnella calospora MUT 4182]